MPTINLTEGQRAQRKTLITVARWMEGNEEKTEILGTRTEDSSIEFNADIETITDVRGITYTDVNKTEPQQTFDPFYILGGSDLSSYLSQAALKNDIDAYNNKFDIYIIAAYMTEGEATPSDGKFYTVKHSHCTILPTSIGGDTYNSMPIELHYSNDIAEGTVDKLTKDFVFSGDVSA